MKTRFWKALWVAGAMAVATTAAQAETLVIATQKSGTVNWELDTIGHYGLDTANGFELSVRDMAGGPAAQVAFQGGEADAIVSDWIWVARQRAAGRDYVFIPYSRAVGGVLVSDDSPVQTLADLKGRKIGIAGGPVDKSWIILQAYAAKELGMDLAAETQQVFGAPPLIFKAALDGDIAGAINFWHFAAKQKARGFHEVLTVAEAAAALGLDPQTPLLGYVLRGDLARDKPDLVAGFAAASRAAKDLLATDDAAWDRLRPIMNAETDADFEALKAGFREGIPSTDPVNEDAVAAMFALMAELGGEELVGTATTLPEGVFFASGQ